MVNVIYVRDTPCTLYMYTCTVIVKNHVISFRLLFGKKLAMDGQNFKNFAIMILQVNKIDSVSWSVSQAVSQSVCLSICQSVSLSVCLSVCQSVSLSVCQLVSQPVSQSASQSVSQLTCQLVCQSVAQKDRQTYTVQTDSQTVKPTMQTTPLKIHQVLSRLTVSLILLQVVRAFDQTFMELAHYTCK